MLGALRSEPNFVNKTPDTGKGVLFGNGFSCKYLSSIYTIALFGNDDVWYSVNHSHYGEVDDDVDDDDGDDVDDDDPNDDVEIG